MTTVTISLNTIWQPSDGVLLEKLREALPALNISAVERGLFSNRYAITFLADWGSNQDVTLLFLAVLSDLGYQADVLKVDAGGVSTIPGGVSQATEAAAKTTSKILIPAAIIAGVVLIFVYVPKPKN